MANNGFLTANMPEKIGLPSKHRRSLSVTPSQRSSKSRITLVEYDSDLAVDQEKEAVDANKIVYRTPKYTWRDHLLGALCFNVSKGKDYTIEEEVVGQPKLIREPEMDYSSSPWILPVYVLSTRKDTEKHTVPKLGKCTIDTGCMQGNIVSRAFVEDVLEFSPANFCELTAEEKKGGTSITGHTLLPDGAIYLTWYHKKSTRVFRNMRFLISPNQHCDLIIGARSILKDKLLSVPNLIDEGATDWGKNKLIIKFKNDGKDEIRTKLYNAWHRESEPVVELQGEITKLERRRLSHSAEDEAIKPMQSKLLVAVLELEIYDWNLGKEAQAVDSANAAAKTKENFDTLGKMKIWDPTKSLLCKLCPNLKPKSA